MRGFRLGLIAAAFASLASHAALAQSEPTTPAGSPVPPGTELDNLYGTKSFSSPKVPSAVMGCPGLDAAGRPIIIACPISNAANTVTQGPQAAQQSGYEWFVQDLVTHAGLGSPADAAATGTSNGSVIALLKALRAQLAGSIATTGGPYFQTIQPMSDSGLEMSASATAGATRANDTGTNRTQTHDDTLAAAQAGTGVRVSLYVGGSPNAASNPLFAQITNTVPVSGTFYQATQPISAVALPLPLGAATDGTDNAGVVQVNSGAGSRGWLSGIQYNLQLLYGLFSSSGGRVQGVTGGTPLPVQVVGAASIAPPSITETHPFLTANTDAPVLAANPARRGLEFYIHPATCAASVGFDTAAVVGTGVTYGYQGDVGPGQAWLAGIVPRNAIHIITAQTGCTVIVREYQ